MASPATRRVAIIGGGFSGATAAAELGSNPRFEVVVYDQGRRGPGGRASHRRVPVGADGP